MKKILALLSALALIFAFALAGCGEYTPPVEKPPVTVDPDPDNPDKPDNPDNPDKEEPFTVELIYEDKSFNPGKGVYALWYEIGGNGIFRAPFDSNGVAECSGLDGDYRVTLSELPAGFTYNPNIETNIADNDNKNVSIEMFALNPTTGGGTDIYTDIITLNKIGAYRATLTSREHAICFQYAPQTPGDYSITSIIDTTANVINPIIDIYGGSTQYKYFIETRDGGGYSNTFTKNFQWKIGIDRGYIGGIFAFKIHADALSDDAFPVDIDFLIGYNGEFSGEKPIEYKPVPVTEQFISVPDAAGLTFNYVASLQPNNLLDGSPFELGEDGYYRFIDGGARLYVMISQASEIMDSFTDGLVNKKVKGKDYNAMVSEYDAHTNSNGVYPVTEEFKQFLTDYCNANLLFNDGNGWAETSPQHYNSTIQNQWLFACGFYTSGGAYGKGGTIADLNYSN